MAGIVDLTGTALTGPVTMAGASGDGFPQRIGARKFVIKNLRPAPREDDVRHYYERTRLALDDALRCIFRDVNPPQPYETLYRGVEDVCRAGHAGDLYEKLRGRCEEHLSTNVLPHIRAKVQTKSNLDLLKVVNQSWKEWNDQLVRYTVPLHRTSVFLFSLLALSGLFSDPCR